MRNKDKKVGNNTLNDVAQKRELLKRLLEEEKQRKQTDKSTAAKAKLNLKKRPANLQYLPLSFAQEALWFVDKVNPGKAGYNTILALLLKGKLDLAVLYRTFETLQQRHEVLRTCFVETDEVLLSDKEEIQPGDDNAQVTAVIHEQLNLPLTEIDFSQEIDAHSKLENVIQKEMESPFDLSRAPLYRAILISINDADHRLILTVHHIISDGWSTGVLYAEFCRTYQAYAEGRDVSLTPAVQYLDYAIAQRGFLTKDVLEKQLTYWKQQLSDAPQLELPKDYTCTSGSGYQGISKSRVIPAVLSKAIRKLSQEQGVTVFVTMLSVFNLLMHRYSGQDDIVIGTPLTIRNTPELEKVVGLLINMAVLRMQVPSEISFKAFVKSNRKMMLDAHDNSDLPFNYLVKALQPHREANVNPFFQVVFAQDMVASPVLHQGHSADHLSIQVHDSNRTSNNKVTRFDIEAFLKDWGDDLGIEFICNKQLFDESTVDRMLEHFTNLLTTAVAEPDKPIDLLPMLSSDERHVLLEQWNQAVMDYPRNQTVAELFERQVSASPDSIAAEYEGETLSYSQLNEQANQVAYYLQARGVGPEVIVGICLERSLEMLVALVGVLKAGGAYLPLDPAYPQSRLNFMLEDADVPVLLTLSSLHAQFESFSGNTICLDSDWAKIEKESADNPAPSATANNLAYVIYTSGSTGQPKGVMVTHNNVTRLFAATEQWYGFTVRDVWTLFHSSAFDFSVWEIWGALLHGGRLVVVPFETSRSPDLFYDLLVEAGVTVLNQTPSAFKQLMKADETRAAESLSALRLVIFGGEALNPQSLGPWFEKHSDVQPQLVNMYGITETTVHVTYCPLTSSVVERSASVIGRPIPDLQIYILDRHHQPVPIGVPGEMCIGGAGLARGYLNRPELTAERFIANPFSDRPEARLYKTGDLARYLPDGDIEFLGRTDHQVKLRGFRVELGEVETELLSLESVKDAVVVVHQDKSGDKRLVAYLVMAHSDGETVSCIREYLKKRLPEYMVPSVFMPVEKIALNSNGKVDYRKLQEPEATRNISIPVVEPAGQFEKSIVEIWKQVLKLEKIGVEDNFFDLGGDSFLMIQLHTALEDTLARKIPITDLFRFSTVRDFARHYKGNRALSTDSQVQLEARAFKQRAAMRKKRKISSHVR